jgi:hypothetical protein
MSQLHAARLAVFLHGLLAIWLLNKNLSMADCFDILTTCLKLLLTFLTLNKIMRKNELKLLRLFL